MLSRDSVGNLASSCARSGCFGVNKRMRAGGGGFKYRNSSVVHVFPASGSQGFVGGK